MNNFISNKISIIIPIYNVEQYILNCLDSILNQTYTNFEVLLINDGSNDNSKSICLDFITKDSRFVYYEQENKGVSEARNFGIEKAKGEWICFVDPDDLVEFDYLNNFINNKEDSDTLLISDINRNNIENNYRRNFLGFEDLEINLKDQFNILYQKRETVLGFPFNKFYHSDTIKRNKLKFIKNQTIREDLMFNYEYIKYIKYIKIISNSSYIYFFRNNSAISKRHHYINYIRLNDAENDLLYFFNYKPILKNDLVYEYNFINYLRSLLRENLSLKEQEKSLIYFRSRFVFKYFRPNVKRVILFKYLFYFKFYRILIYFIKKLS